LTSTDAPLLRLGLVEAHLDAIGWLWTMRRALCSRMASSEVASIDRRAQAHLRGLRARKAEARRKAGLLLHAPFAAQLFAGMFALLHLDRASVLNERGEPRVRRARSLPVVEALHYAEPGGPWAFAERS
jgi:hypothetical protein